MDDQGKSAGRSISHDASAPVSKQYSQIERVYLAVTIQVSGAIVGWIGAGAPGAQENCQIKGVHAAIEIEVCGVAVAAGGRAGRVGGIGPGGQKQRPVVAVGLAVKIHISPLAAGPAAGFGREALLEVKQVILVHLATAIEVTPADFNFQAI